VFSCLSSLDRSGHLNGSAEKQKLFRESGFPGIGMTDDTECAATVDFFLQLLTQIKKFLNIPI